LGILNNKYKQLSINPTTVGQSKGFTLIEIVLVLAIAGLIMVIVFLAVAGAQAARRDTQRKSDINRMRAAIEQSASNNGGVLPVSNAFVGTYLTNFTDPSSGVGYVVTYVATAPALTPLGNVSYHDSNICNAGHTAMIAGTARQYAIDYVLEQGGVVCVDNR
jgi:prepilin-type N-terminal cleavage/methylation domain-containing protein